jgi:hypothetical protein
MNSSERASSPEMVLKVPLMTLPYLIGFVAGYAISAAISHRND